MKPSDALLALLVTAVWGANFSVIKIGLQSIDPFILAGLRFLLCAFPLVLIVPRPRVHYLYIVAYGLLFGVGLWGIVNLGIKSGVSAGIASLVLQLSAFFTIYLGVVALHERVSLSQIGGTILASAGLAIILRATQGSASRDGIMMILLAALAWSGANVVLKKSRTENVAAFLIWSSLLSPLPLFLISYLLGGTTPFSSSFSHASWTSLLCLLFQVYPVTIFGYSVWNSMLRKYPISTVAPLSLLVPIFGVVFAHLLLGESFDAQKLLASALILSGLIVGLYGKYLYMLIVKAQANSAERS